MAKTEKKDGFNSSLSSLSDLLKKPKPVITKQDDRLLDIPLDEIEEDPNQPRQEFDDDFLKWLASDIEQRGIKTPISVKPKGENGKYLINHGANRYRASIIADQKTIPAVIDPEHDPFDQVNENIKRESLSARDLALWIKARLDDGIERKTIMERLEVPASFISQHLGILKLPAEIMSMIYDAGLVREERVLYEISLALKADRDKTFKYCEGIVSKGGTTFKEASDFKKSLKEDNKRTTNSDKESNSNGLLDTDDHGRDLKENEKVENNSETQSNPSSKESQTSINTLRKPLINVKHEGREGLLLYKTPASDGLVWVEYEDRSRIEAPADQVLIISITESE